MHLSRNQMEFQILPSWLRLWWLQRGEQRRCCTDSQQKLCYLGGVWEAGVELLVSGGEEPHSQRQPGMNYALVQKVDKIKIRASIFVIQSTQVATLCCDAGIPCGHRWWPHMWGTAMLRRHPGPRAQHLFQQMANTPVFMLCSTRLR